MSTPVALDLALPLTTGMGQSRMQSMTLNGQEPNVDTWELQAMEFAGVRAPLELGPNEGVDLYAQLHELSLFVLWPVLILLVGALCLRGGGADSADGIHLCVC